MTYRQLLTRVTASVAAIAFGAAAATAQPWVFTNWDGDHFWNNPGNWNQDTPPPTGQVAWINHTPDEALINEFAFGDPSEIIIGQGTPPPETELTNHGAVRVTTGGDIQTSHISLAWGEESSAPWDGTWAQDGGTTLVTGEVRAGRGSGGGTATINISGGVFDVGNDIYLGHQNVGGNNMTVSGGNVTVRDLQVAAREPDTTATASLDISGGTVTINRNFDIGRNGGPATAVISGGDVTVTGFTRISSIPEESNTAEGSLTITGGTFNSANVLSVGPRMIGGVMATGQGSLTIGGDADVSWNVSLAMRPGNAFFTVEGSNATIRSQRPSATGFEVHQDNHVSFVLDSAGISTVDLGTSQMRWSHADNTLNVNATAFTGEDVFDLFTFDSYFDTGIFQFGTENLTFSPGHSGFVSYNPQSITLTIEANGVPDIPGDFNMDGRVDAADYTVWRDGLGTTHTLAQYDEWKGNFGASVPGSGALASAAVPEPTSAGLLVMAALLTWAWRPSPASQRHAPTA